jgi:pyruvate/2-oxoglutarate dehydrogenase complex dihydrolipoamide acyltransferase (E2) component
MLGALAKKARRLLPGAGSPHHGSAQPGPSAGHAPGMAALSPAETSGDSLPVPPPDADLVQRTTDALLKGLNEIGRRKLVKTAAKIGADDKMLDRYRTANVISDDRRHLMVTTAPTAVEAMGITNGKHFALGVFFGNLGLCGVDFWLAVDELNAIADRIEKKQAQAAPTPTPAAPASTGVTPAHNSIPAAAAAPRPAAPVPAPVAAPAGDSLASLASTTPAVLPLPPAPPGAPPILT